MRRLGMVLAAAALIAVAGCSKKNEPGPAPEFSPPVSAASPSASDLPATASPGPTGSVTAAKQFTVDGAGPLALGAALADLQTAGVVKDVQTSNEVCPGNSSAKGMGQWEGITVHFRKDGKAYMVMNDSTAIPTPSGAWIGNTLPALKNIYKSLGEEIGTGDAKAFLVKTASGRGILFDLEPGTQKVIKMIAGDAAYLKTTFTGGTDAC